VITGLIKANIPTRISFMVSSAVDSRTIIDMGGAERLLGRGDMLYLPADAGRPERIQGAFLSDEEANSLADYWRRQIIEHAITIGEETAQVQAEPAVEPGWELKDRPAEEFELDDDLLDRAEEIVREYGRASISLLQRRLRVGYSRAARLIDLLEQRGIIGQSESGGRGREVYDSGQSNGYPHRGGSDGHSMADVVEDIVAEERARDEFLRKQAARFQQQPDQDTSPPSI
jgi:DNA segregation ATPase FtsK/SpoIIIE-like protein